MTGADDGFSGVTFTRPAFMEMMDLAEQGEIGTIIVKDHSRAEKRRELAKAKKRVGEVDRLIQKIYEDNVVGRFLMNALPPCQWHLKKNSGS